MQNQTVNPSMQGSTQHNINQAWLNNNGFQNQSNQLQAPTHQTPSFSGSISTANLNANAQMMANLLTRQQQMTPQPPMNNGMPQLPSGQQSAQTAMQPTLPQGLPVEPITEPNRFREALQKVLQSVNQQINPQYLQVDNRAIDLHKLHCEVLRMGGERMVSIYRSAIYRLLILAP